MSNKTREVILDLDDFQCDVNMEELFIMKEHYPDFKVSLFTIPLHKGLLTGKVEIEKVMEWAKMINGYDWIEVCVHGFAHFNKEMEVDKKTAEKLISGSEKMLDRIGLKYKKIWKSPYWQASNEAYQVLRDNGYTVATNKDIDRPDIEGMKQYRFNWSIDQLMPIKKILKGHGHLTTMDNSITKCVSNLMNLPTDTKWLTISDYIKKYGSD